ncbi:MAG: glycosyltransferase family 2 protein [Terriglobales bacterium]
MNTKTISVIIPTKHRPADLENVVASLLAQTTPPMELLIVDQSDNAESQLRVEGLLARARRHPQPIGMTLRYLRVPFVGGGAAARNLAMDLAQGAIWLFLDDDVVLEPAFLSALRAAYHAHPEAVGISGVVTNYARPPLPYRCWRGLFARGCFHDDRQGMYWRAKRFRHGPVRRVTRLGGGLMSFRAAAVRRVRFDENLTGVCDGEDVDFCSRLGQDSVLLIAPAARLTHCQSLIGRERDHPLRRQVRSDAYLYRRNWRRLRGARLGFAWLRLGYALAALAASLRRGSWAPWRALRAGLEDAHRIALRSAPSVAVAAPVHAQGRTP